VDLGRTMSRVNFRLKILECRFHIIDFGKLARLLNLQPEIKPCGGAYFRNVPNPAPAIDASTRPYLSRKRLVRG
jgi:hypothetical protein